VGGIGGTSAVVISSVAGAFRKVNSSICSAASVGEDEHLEHGHMEESNKSEQSCEVRVEESFKLQSCSLDEFKNAILHGQFFNDVKDLSELAWT
jgi:hypothetical protein